MLLGLSAQSIKPHGRVKHRHAIIVRPELFFLRIIWRWDTTARGPVYEILLGVGSERRATHPLINRIEENLPAGMTV
jgi:hypothetical protein